MTSTFKLDFPTLTAEEREDVSFMGDYLYDMEYKPKTIDLPQQIIRSYALMLLETYDLSSWLYPTLVDVNLKYYQAYPPSREAGIQIVIRADLLFFAVGSNGRYTREVRTLDYSGEVNVFLKELLTDPDVLKLADFARTELLTEEVQDYLDTLGTTLKKSGVATIDNTGHKIYFMDEELHSELEVYFTVKGANHIGTFSKTFKRRECTRKVAKRMAEYIDKD